MTDRPEDLRRRRWMRVALCGAAALATGTAHAQRKLTREEAEYQDEPVGGIMMCGTCTLFEPPAGCKVMEGDVAVTGWCKLFDLAD
jgi:hypothetical protein